MQPGLRTDQSDAQCLRDAAWVLRTRARKRTFAARLVEKYLFLAADEVDKRGEWRAVTGQDGRSDG